MVTGGMSGFSQPRTGCFGAAMMVLLMVGILVGIGFAVWYFGLREVFG